MRMALLAGITKLRLLTCHPRLVDMTARTPSAKFASAMSLFDELVLNDRRALVFSQFTRHLRIYRDALDKRGISFLYLDGETSHSRRAALVERWARGVDRFFLISLRAGGTGLNLTGADVVIHLDPWWNPALEDQATDRTHRIGQTRPVTVVRMISRSTIEEAVLALHQRKREIARAICAGADSAGALSVEELMDLVRCGVGRGSRDGYSCSLASASSEARAS